MPPPQTLHSPLTGGRELGHPGGRWPDVVSVWDQLWALFPACLCPVGPQQGWLALAAGRPHHPGPGVSVMCSRVAHTTPGAALSFRSCWAPSLSTLACCLPYSSLPSSAPIPRKPSSWQAVRVQHPLAHRPSGRGWTGGSHWQFTGGAAGFLSPAPISQSFSPAVCLLGLAPRAANGPLRDLTRWWLVRRPTGLGDGHAALPLEGAWPPVPSSPQRGGGAGALPQTLGFLSHGPQSTEGLGPGASKAPGSSWY